MALAVVTVLVVAALGALSAVLLRQTDQAVAAPAARVPAATVKTVQAAPTGPSYDEVWNRCFQAHYLIANGEYDDVADYCRQLAESVAR